MNLSNFTLDSVMHGVGIGVDIAVVYSLVYYLLRWIRNVHSLAIIRGVVFVGFLYVVFQVLQLHSINWVLSQLTSVFLIILVVVFQHDLRRLLERLGDPRWFMSVDLYNSQESTRVIKQLLRAVDILSKKKIGGLLVIEMNTDLSPYINTGIKVDASVSAELLVTLFWPNSPTHDGAIILQKNKISSVDCLLPLSEAYLIDRSIGTRHRAALGLSESTDALIIIVSEETGIVSLAENGNLTRYLNREALEARFFKLYKEPMGNTQSAGWLRSWLTKA